MGNEDLQKIIDSQHKALKDNYLDMRSLLEGQQKRQADIIKIALAAVLANIVCSCLTFCVLAQIAR